MRFDNPIYNHKFRKMYDIASFPDVRNEYRQEKNLDCSNLLKFFRQNDLTSFDKELTRIIELSYKEKKKDTKEQKYFYNWKLKLDRYFNFYQNFKINSKLLSNSQTFTDLFERGYSFHEISKKNLISINNKISKKINFLKKNKKNIKSGFQEYDRRVVLDKKWNDFLNDIYTKEGLLSAIRSYYNKPYMKVESSSLRILTDKDLSPFQFLRDCKNFSKHVNLHTDPLEGYMTSIIYLSDVKEGEGGTQFLPKSNRYIYDELQDIFARSVSTGNYCNNRYARSVIFRLPRFLRVTKNWGRLVKKGSFVEKYLDKNLVSFISSKHGNCSIFEAGSILHNAVVQKGTRIALQVIFN